MRSFLSNLGRRSLPFYHFKYILPLPSGLQNFFWKSAVNFVEIHLFVVFPYLLLIFLSLYLIFVNLFVIIFGMFLFGFILYGMLWPSWTLVAISFPMLEKFVTIISPNLYSYLPPFFFLLTSLWDQYNSNFSSFFFILLCFHYFYYFIFQLTYLSSASVILLLVPSTKVKVAQSYPTVCDPMDYTAHGILQARILEWVAFPSSRGSSQPGDRTQVSLILATMAAIMPTFDVADYRCSWVLTSDTGTGFGRSQPVHPWDHRL